MNRKSNPALIPDIPTINELSGFADTHKDQYITEVRKYELITPLFGGGVEGGVNDPVTPIRASNIRGHLRFWWRATRGGTADSNLTNEQRLADMKQREAVIWGSASTRYGTGGPSKVQIVVEVMNNGKEFKATDQNGYITNIGNPKSIYSYVTFPLKELGSKAIIQESIKFNLKITYKFDQKIDVHAALWAWETFGGIGARTRRGFGALSNNEALLTALPHTKDEVESWLKENLNFYVVNGLWPKGVPFLPKVSSLKRLKIIIGKSQVSNPVVGDTTKALWLTMINCLKDFRQARTHRFGRSKWPEPDTIRRITNQFLNENKLHKPIHPIRNFPRAAFGLPIVIKFKDDKESNPNFRNPDPDKTTIQLSFADRLSSPLIIRPLLCSNKDVVGIAFILNGTELAIGEQVVLMKNHTLVPNSSTRHDIQHPDTLPLIFQNSLTTSATLTPDPSTKSLNILEEFLDFLEKETC